LRLDPLRRHPRVTVYFQILVLGLKFVFSDE